MIALIFFYTDKKCTLKKSVSTKCWKITINIGEIILRIQYVKTVDNIPENEIRDNIY